MATTLLLDREAWDLCLDVSGNIALASDPYSQTQDAASECRVFLGEDWYDTTMGIPYDTQVLGFSQPPQILSAQLQRAAERVPGVLSARAVLVGPVGRSLSGQIQITTASGQQVATTL